MVNVDDYPAMLVMPRGPTPPVLSGVHIDKAAGDIWCRFFRRDTELLLRKYGLDRFSPPPFPADVFRRGMAKIAHSFLMAELGMGKFRPLLNLAILNQIDRHDIFYYLGGSMEILDEDPECLHWITWEEVQHNESRHFLVKFRLFANVAESPVHLALAGQALEGVVYPEPVTKKVLNAENVKVFPRGAKFGPFSETTIKLWGQRV
jgi:hypothetical protein